MGFWRQLLILLLMVHCSSCGPTCIEPNGELADDVGFCYDVTYEALQFIDDQLLERGYVPVSEFVDVTWLPGSSFVVENGDGMGRDLYGRFTFLVNGRGPRCGLFVSTRNQTLVSRTSLTHEMAHCSQAVTTFFNVGTSDTDLDGDKDHSRREVWDDFVPSTNVLLEALGL
jgi:hypothetical protein